MHSVVLWCCYRRMGRLNVIRRIFFIHRSHLLTHSSFWVVVTLPLSVQYLCIIVQSKYIGIKTGLAWALLWQNESHFSPIKLMFYLITVMIMFMCGLHEFLLLYCILCSRHPFLRAVLVPVNRLLFSHQHDWKLNSDYVLVKQHQYLQLIYIIKGLNSFFRRIIM